MRKLLASLLVVAFLGLFASTAASAGRTTIRLKDDFFSPSAKTIKKGTRVRFLWAGESAHNVTVTKGPRKFESSTKAEGDYRRTLSRKGRYTIVCTLHEGMTLKLRVR